MRSNNILHIIVFIAAFALSTIFTGFFVTTNSAKYSFVPYTEKSATAVNIERFLQRDVHQGDTRDVQTYQLDDASSVADHAEIVSEYQAASGSMNDANFPADFQRAWREHMRAWKNYADFLNEQKDAAVDRDFNESDFQKADDRLGREINRTWSRVLRLADRYGADVRGF